jgi:hypothetical protein
MTGTYIPPDTVPCTVPTHSSGQAIDLQLPAPGPTLIDVSTSSCRYHTHRARSMHVHQATRAIYYGLHPRGKPGLTLGADTKTRLVSFLTDMGPAQKVLLPGGLELGVLTDLVTPVLGTESLLDTTIAAHLALLQLYVQGTKQHRHTLIAPVLFRSPVSCVPCLLCPHCPCLLSPHCPLSPLSPMSPLSPVSSVPYVPTVPLTAHYWAQRTAPRRRMFSVSTFSSSSWTGTQARSIVCSLSSACHVHTGD